MLRIAGSVAILWILIAVLPAGSLQSAFAQASPVVFTIAFTIHFLAHLVAALKWRMLMGPGAEVSAMKAFKAHFTGLIGNLSPLGMVGGDIVRAGIAINGSTRPAAIMFTSVADRIVDTAALLLLTLAGFVWIGGGSSIAAAVLWGGAALLTSALVLSIIALAWVSRTTSERLSGIRDAVQMCMRRPGLIGQSLLLSLGVQLAFIAANAYIGTDVGVHASFGAWLVAWPAAKLAGYVPIAIAGIGIRESALIALLRPFGAAPGAVMAASLLWQGVFIGGALLGWLVWTVLPGLATGVPHRSQAR
jgi:uncharacterized membrane protein YbhN (UPF0104 family)